MADMMSIIAANYKTVGMTVPSKTPYVAVDPALYEGSWTGSLVQDGWNAEERGRGERD